MLPGLRRARESRLLTQRELAAKAGLAQATIVRLENQQQPAQLRTVRKLAEALEVQPAQLMEPLTTAEPPPATPGEQGEEPRG